MKEREVIVRTWNEATTDEIECSTLFRTYEDDEKETYAGYVNGSWTTVDIEKDGRASER